MRRVLWVFLGVISLAAQAPDARAIVRAFDQLIHRPLWPGYEPAKMPLAIFDGKDTWLFRHPSPPGDFAPVPGEAGLRVFHGRWQDVTANSSALIHGIPTATLLPSGGDAKAWAGTMVHEGFHVFQRRHPEWRGNEADLFTYPLDTPAVLAGRRLEFEALRRALEAKDDGEARAWARAALDERRARFALMPPEAGAYEEGSELNEGLANTVQFRAERIKAQTMMPYEEFPAERLRDRFYASGPAFAQLLDRFASGWDARMENGELKSLSSALAATLGEGKVASFSEAELERERARAEGEAGSIREGRKAAREAFFRQPGWQVMVRADTQWPLFPQGFDPLNVRLLSPLDILHSRFLKAGNGAGNLELVGGQALSEGLGPHPLWNGMGAVTVAGLPAKPTWFLRADGHLVFEAQGLKGDFKGAVAEARGQVLEIRLQSPNP